MVLNWSKKQYRIKQQNTKSNSQATSKRQEIQAGNPLTGFPRFVLAFY